MNKRKYDFKFKNFLFLLLAGVVNSVGVTLFLYPLKVFDSGISGLSMLLDFLIEPVNISVFLICINVPIFIFGHKKQGLVFTIYSIFAILVYSGMSFLFTKGLNIDLSKSPIAGNDLLLCSIFGGILSGIGSGLVIRFGGALDGIEVLSVIFAKKIGISIGTFVMLFNIVLYISCGIALHEWLLPLYSVIAYFVGSKTLDFVVDGFDKSKCAMIITTKPKEINACLSEKFESAGTSVKAVGGYTNKEKSIVYFVLNHFQINKLKNLVHDIDDQAFISIHDITDIIKWK